jgi:hypothetical protein
MEIQAMKILPIRKGAGRNAELLPGLTEGQKAGIITAVAGKSSVDRARIVLDFIGLVFYLCDCYGVHRCSPLATGRGGPPSIAPAGNFKTSPAGVSTKICPPEYDDERGSRDESAVWGC